MTTIERINTFLKEAGTFYVATVDKEGRPKNRPFGLHFLQDGKIYFGAGTFKDVYAQLKADPHIEISANKGLEFIRYYGKAVMVDDDALVEKAFEVMPNLKKIYNEETGYKLGMFYIDEATVEFRRLITLNEKIEL